MLRKLRIIYELKLQRVSAIPIRRGVREMLHTKQQSPELNELIVSTLNKLRLLFPRSDRKVDVKAPTRCPSIMNVSRVASFFLL